ncbi:MAG: ParB/RepB/Spo0J family partition protein [Oscillospiraceae bacterium]|nr:ParB/RepB/Spo0J family partition protein [Oscillospiraceae bacterium]
MSPKGGLGTGLGAIFGEAMLDNDQTDFSYLPIEKVEPNKEQPRKYFDHVALQELTDSIREHGILDPLLVRKLASGYYQIIGGERRWRAAREVGLKEVPCRIIEADDRLATEIALIDNLQRENLNPLEEAEGYKTLMETFELKQEEVATRVGKDRSTVANALRLLRSNPEVKGFLEQGTLSAGHARALLKIKDENQQLVLARKVIEEGLSVRQTEKQADKVDKLRAEKAAAPSAAQKPKPFVDYTKEAEDNLTRSLGRKVKIISGQKRGWLEVDYYDTDDLEVLIEALKSLKLSKGKK